MSRRLLLVCVSGLLGVLPLPAEAQQTPGAEGPYRKCSSAEVGGGATCASDRRVVLVVEREGPGAPDDLEVIAGMGASQAGLFRLELSRATAVDSVIYGVISIHRDAAGDYAVRTRLEGPQAPPEACASASTGGARSDMVFGAVAAREAAELARCVARVRARLTGR